MNCVLHYFQMSEAVRPIMRAFSPAFCHLSSILGPGGHEKIESDSEGGRVLQNEGRRLSGPRSELFNTGPGTLPAPPWERKGTQTSSKSTSSDHDSRWTRWDVDDIWEIEAERSELKIRNTLQQRNKLYSGIYFIHPQKDSSPILLFLTNGNPGSRLCGWDSSSGLCFFWVLMSQCHIKESVCHRTYSHSFPFLFGFKFNIAWKHWHEARMSEAMSSPS